MIIFLLLHLSSVLIKAAVLFVHVLERFNLKIRDSKVSKMFVLNRLEA